MIPLPHKEPLIFAKEIVFKDDNSVTVLCEFENIPTLPVILEAAAQSSIAFNDENEEPKVGFLTTAKNLKQNESFYDKTYLIKVEVLVLLDNLRQFKFRLLSCKDSTKEYVSGIFSIYIKP